MDNTIQPDELEEARQPSGYTIAELCRDLQIIEHDDDRLAKHSVDSGFSIPAVGPNSPDVAAMLNRMLYRDISNRLSQETFAKPGVDDVQVAAEGEWGDRLQSRHVRILRARMCDEMNLTLEVANAKSVIDFGIWLKNSRNKSVKSHAQFSPPVQIHDSLSRFRTDYPDPSNVVFLIMQFGETKAHLATVKAIRASFAEHGLTVLRADDKEYHEQLFSNVQTYMHGCGAGVALFERIESDNFNPNVSLEVGYMIAQGKPVCLLKDKTLKSLPTDLVGTLYKDFSTQDPGKTIQSGITQWVNDRDLSKR